MIKHLWQYYKLSRNQWLKPEELEELQWKKLKQILNHAYETVPFYRKKFQKAGITPNDIKTKKDMLKIPVTTKEELRKNFPVISQNYSLNELHKGKTTGSTGEPVESFFDRDSWIYGKYLLKLRTRRACGLSVFDKIAVISAATGKKKGRGEKQKFSLMDKLSRLKHFSIFENLEEPVFFYKHFKPTIIESMPSFLFKIAEFLEKNNINYVKPKMLFSTAEMLSLKQRKLIEKIFNAPLYDIYGLVELKEISWQCKERKHYHINSDSFFVEFVKNSKHVNANQEGEIVCTTLYNKAMPLIRYTVGDVGKPLDEKCSCGRSFPLMGVLIGRSTDFILLPSGKIISPYSLTFILEDALGVKQYQIIQEKKNLIRIKIRTTKEFSKKSEKDIRKKILKRVNNETDLIIDIVEKIPREKTGKYRTVRSKVKK